jgi:hypothetical protein
MKVANIFIARKRPKSHISPTKKVVNEYKKYRKRAPQRVPKQVYAFSHHVPTKGAF